MTFARLLLGIATLATGLAACNSITGLGDDYTLEDDAGADTGSDPPDTSVPPDGSSTMDVAQDVEIDAGDGGDASDAQPDAPVSTFCADAGPTVFFCTDFEEANPLAKWDQQQIKGGNGQLSIVAGQGIGGSKAYRAFASESATDRTVAVWKALSGVPSVYLRYTARFSFFIKKKTIEYGNFGVLGFVQQNQSFDPYYGLATYPNGKLDQSDPPSPMTGITADGTLNVWHSATMIFERVGAGPSFNGKIIVDGTTVDELRPMNGTGAAATELRLGYLFTSTDPGDAEVLFDNVIVFRE